MAKITLENVSVSFPVYTVSSRSLKNSIFYAATGGRFSTHHHTHVTVDALKEVSFHLKEGDRIGLVGHNGAGKSTILRVLAGIYSPTRGKVEIEGVVAPLFDAGLGFNAEATGYENIMLRGLLLGLTKEEIKDKSKEIAEFSELGDYLHLPVRTFSSGMQTRLAFATSTAIEPDILLLDEIIGAGDADFMKKAEKRLESLIFQSEILVLASHSEHIMQRFCSKIFKMHQGEIQDIIEIG